MLALPLLALAGSAAAQPALATSPFLVSVSATPTSGAVPLTVLLSATVSSGTPTSVSWSFGDGASWSGAGLGALDVTHRYVSVGSFAAVATVTESAGVVAGSTTVAVANGPIVAAISATPSAGASPLSVVFRAVVSGGTGTYPTFDWSFGDGTSAAGPVVSHTFRAAGTYSVALAVADSANSTGAASFSLSVSPAASASPTSELGPATLAGAGILGGGLTFGVYYNGRRRRAPRDDLDDGSGYGAVPPGAFGPVGAPLPAPLGAAESSEATGAAALSEPAPAGLASAARVVLTPRPTIQPPVPTSVPVPGGSPATSEPRRWSRDLVAYLGSLPTLGPDDIPTLAWTQKGMSDRLGTGQNQVSNVLRRLTSSGLVIEELQHVQGQPRRLKVYRLSMRGEALAREMRRNRPGAPRDSLKREW